MTFGKNFGTLAAAVALVAPLAAIGQATAPSSGAAVVTAGAEPRRPAGNGIEQIASQVQGAATVVRIDMAKPLAAVPVSFSVANPPRIAIDLPDTDNRTGQSSLELGQGEVRTANVVSVGGRSRLVLNLKRAATYTAAVEGKTLVLRLDTVQAATTGNATVASTGVGAAYSFAKADPAVAGQALRDVDFRRGRDSEGRVIVELGDAKTGVDIRQQGNTVVVDFLKTRLPENLRRRLDVADFGTPIKSVRVFQQGEHARMVIEPQGLWEHNAYQSDTQFVVEVKPLREDPNKLAQGNRGYQGDKLSLNFQNIDIRALLQVIADFTGMNIVTSDSVAGSLTLRLKDVPWDQALDIVLQSKGLDMRKNGNVMLIAPREELEAKEKIAGESRQQLEDLEPLRNEVFQLNYQKAEDVVKLLSDDKQKILTKRGSVVPDPRTNKLFVQDVGSRLDNVRRIVQQIDIPVRQVLIEARIVEADDRFSRNLGTRLGFNDLSGTVYRTTAVTDPVTGQPTALNVPVYGVGRSLGPLGFGSIAGNQAGVADVSSQAGTTISGTNAPGLSRLTALNNTNFVSLPAAAIAGASPASFAISLFGSSLTRFLNLEISALEADQRGKVVSSPRVLTSDQRSAIIEQGTELPFQTATASGATAITFRKANLRLAVTPQITPEGNVIMTVQINRDSVGQLTPAGFAIDTRAVQTQVLVENGGTVVIGGIYEQFERNRTNKVPVLGDVPVVGNLFKNVQRTNDRTELLVFLTPRVVSDAALAR